MDFDAILQFNDPIGVYPGPLPHLKQTHIWQPSQGLHCLILLPYMADSQFA